MTNLQAGDPNYPGIALPDVIDPPDSLCFLIHVPNDPHHIAAFYGAIHQLTQWISWQRDPQKRGKDAAAVWREIYWNLKPQPCIPPLPFHGAEQEDFMPLRVDCDCNVWITCCDGTEKQLLTADQVKKLLQSQPAQGQPQPPAGQCQQYSGQFNASSAFLVPTVVSTGDTLELSATGASSDPDVSVDWRCPNGDLFVAGACIATPILVATDPLPTVPHLRLLYLIAGTYYDAMAGVFTVPGGISSENVQIVVNDSARGDDLGNLTVNATVCNNATATWTHSWDFRTNTGPWGVDPTECGSYVPGVGFVSVNDPTNCVNDDQLKIQMTLPAVTGTYTSWAIAGTNAVVPNIVNINAPAGNDSPALPAASYTYTYTHAIAATNLIYAQIAIRPHSAVGEFIITGATIGGTGTDPF